MKNNNNNNFNLLQAWQRAKCCHGKNITFWEIANCQNGISINIKRKVIEQCKLINWNSTQWQGFGYDNICQYCFDDFPYLCNETRSCPYMN